jgi:hypothetical protein
MQKKLKYILYLVYYLVMKNIVKYYNHKHGAKILFRSFKRKSPGSSTSPP